MPATLRSSYWARPVPGFGDPAARLLIVGLAPGAHGANRTGRPFTGDASGQWLYHALFRYGFASREEMSEGEQGEHLQDVYVTNAVLCVPPQNRPNPDEFERCRHYLETAMFALPRLQLILTLGRAAFVQVQKILLLGRDSAPRWQFRHGAYYSYGQLGILASYHCSQRNTRSGRLTEIMWNEIFVQVCRRLGSTGEP